MKSFVFSFVLLLWAVSRTSCEQERSTPSGKLCRNVPGSAGYPTTAAWNALNASISGRLVDVVPSAKYCATLPGGACTDAQWSSGLFRSTIPGAMDQVNFEQGYDLTPPSLCLRNATTCGQGDVPIYSVEAETVADIQAAVKFASKHNLRVAIKASGHDSLGRSTAPDSLLIRTSHFTNLSFTDAFLIGTQNMGPAVTVGSGVHAQTMYQQGKAHGTIVVSGTGVATLCTAGGYVQGAGFSILSPTLGLAADNALEFHIVVSSGELLQVNSICIQIVGCPLLNIINQTNSVFTVFFALRGGGAGSWGVIVSATFKTSPTFNATFLSLLFSASDNTAASALATLQAKHIFDLDPVRGGHSLLLFRNPTDVGSTLMLNASLPRTTIAQSQALLQPFIDAALMLPGVSLLSQEYVFGDVNDALFLADDAGGGNAVLGSRLIPAQMYRDSPATVGQVYKELLDSGTMAIIGAAVGGGKVAENANISSAVHPAWRAGKSHLIVANGWPDSTSLAEINALRTRFQTQQRPILERLSGANAGAYSNEADVMEANFQTTFFGPNYGRLSAIKRKYDAKDLFIVGAGVGSERWDKWGLCRV